ncbi:hypothetical protein LTR85_007813 [Meristemomyces frigidus]|nr:hypothetical protein LTR85_007813 [Meristemomyces frigidus]
MDTFEKDARAAEQGQIHDADAEHSSPRETGNNTFCARVWHGLANPFRRLATTGNGSNAHDGQAAGNDQHDAEAQQEPPPCAEQDSGLVIRTLEGSPKGYPNLAAFSDSHENFMLYRRFGYLQSRIILDKQDELRALEQQLDSIDDGDLAANLHKLIKREAQGDERKELLVAIETKFCEYALVLLEGQYWSQFAVCSDVDPEQESKQKSQDPDNVYYCKERIAVCALSIITMMILFLLIVPTYFLFCLANKADNGVLSPREIALCIGILLIFTLLFSAVLSLFTGAKRHEILGAAAAYCAVLVVFFGNQA